MALAENSMSRLAERQAAERRLVRDLTRRYDRAVAAGDKARAALAQAEAERAAVLSEWVVAPGWTAERVAEVAGLSQRELSDAVKAASGAGRQSPAGPGAAPAPGPMRRLVAGA